MKREEAKPLHDVGVSYYQPRTWEVMADKAAKVFLYRWTCTANHGLSGVSPHDGIEAVYCYRHEDFLKLLERWNYLGLRTSWSYSELE